MQKESWMKQLVRLCQEERYNGKLTNAVTFLFSRST